MNRIDVFDAIQESQIGSITVPLPWGLDVAPDGSELSVATTFGDVFLIDPGAMKVLQRFPSSTIGPQGYTATQAFVLANGQLALLGALGGLYLDGSPDFAVWNPATNAITIVANSGAGFIGQIAVTADRTKVIVGGAYSQQLALYDPSNDVAITAGFTGGPIEEILPTPDGKRVIVVGLGGNVEVLDASTLASLGSFPNVPGYSAVLSQDGSALYTVDSEANVFAWDANTFAQKGWVSSFDIVDLQDAIVAGAVDETGLIFGPIGHGVVFLDGSAIHQGQQGTQFNTGFLSPPTGPLSGGTSLETEILTGTPTPTITTGTVYLGNAPATNVSLSASAFTGTTPAAAGGGTVDFTVVLPDKSIRLMPEDFSYGPTIVEVSTNAASAEGGGQGAIFGYGFASGPKVTIGGQPAAVTQVLTNASQSSPYPFPMQAVLFTVPPGTPGTAAEDVTVTTANGSATASGSFHYVPAVQSYSLPGSSLLQGVYDPHRSVLYFSDRAQIDVFSPASESWLAPINISFTNANSRLVGLALSPDGNTLAVSDPGNDKIYVLNPSSPTSAKSFFVNTGVNVQPFGLAVTNPGAVYYATHDQDIDPPGGFHKLDTNTGTITNFEPVSNGGQFVRVLLTPDGSHVFVNEGSGDAGIWIVNTANDSLSEGLQATYAGNGEEDAALSGDGTVLLAQNILMDDLLNVFGDVTFVDRDVWLPLAVFGEKLNSDGSLMFQPLTDGIDVHDGHSGLLQYRVMLPIQLANAYDALTIDDPDGILFAITSTGIAQVNLATLPPSTYVHGSPFSSSRSRRGFRPRTRTTKSRRLEWLGRPMLRHPNRSTLNFASR